MAIDKYKNYINCKDTIAKNKKNMIQKVCTSDEIDIIKNQIELQSCESSRSSCNNSLAQLEPIFQTGQLRYTSI